MNNIADKRARAQRRAAFSSRVRPVTRKIRGKIADEITRAARCDGAQCGVCRDGSFLRALHTGSRSTTIDRETRRIETALSPESTGLGRKSNFPRKYPGDETPRSRPAPRGVRAIIEILVASFLPVAKCRPFGSFFTTAIFVQLTEYFSSVLDR